MNARLAQAVGVAERSMATAAAGLEEADPIDAIDAVVARLERLEEALARRPLSERERKSLEVHLLDAEQAIERLWQRAMWPDEPDEPDTGSAAA